MSGNYSVNEPLKEPQLVYWTSAIAVTNCLGIIANILLLTIFFVHKPLRTSSSWTLIVHCIAIDLYICCVSIPITALLRYGGIVKDVPEHYCRYRVIFVHCAYAAGMYATCVLALHRLTAVLSPRFYDLLARKPAQLGMVVLPWVCAAIVGTFPTFGMGIDSHFSLVENCVLTSKNGTGFALPLVTGLGYVLPTLIMGFCYTVVLVKTSRDLAKKKESFALQRRMDISRTLCCSFIWHCITVYPSTVESCFFAKDYPDNLPLHLFIRWLINSFSAINPVFFFAACRLCRDGLHKIISAITTSGRHRIHSTSIPSNKRTKKPCQTRLVYSSFTTSYGYTVTTTVPS